MCIESIYPLKLYFSRILKPIFHKKRICFGYSLRHLTHEMYMPNAKTQRQGPNATYIPLEMRFTLGRNLHQKNEMYMADARNVRHPTPEIPTCWYFLR